MAHTRTRAGRLRELKSRRHGCYKVAETEEFGEFLRVELQSLEARCEELCVLRAR